MTSKTVSIATKPDRKQKAAASADDWVDTRAADEPMKRLTIDVPRSLHARIKSQCALQGTKMADELRGLLEKAFPANQG